MATNQSDYAVYVTDTKGKSVCILPEQEIPAWAEKQITNPYVLGNEEDGEEAASSGDGPPPRAGRGSGKEAWAKYAADNGVDVDGLDRDDIIAKLDDKGVAV